MWLINFIFDSTFYFHQYSVRLGDKKMHQIRHLATKDYYGTRTNVPQN